MNNQALLSVVQGDQNYDLNFTLTDSSGAVVNLTGGTLSFHAQLQSNPAVSFSGNMAIVVAASGTCKYTVASTDFSVAGTYNCQIEVDFASVTEKITFSGIQIVCVDRVPVT